MPVNLPYLINPKFHFPLNRYITDIATGNYCSGLAENTFAVYVDPGKGKLFTLEPTVIGGGSLNYNETIESDVELKRDLIIESGVTLTVNADYHCYGNITINDGGYLKTTGNGKLFFYNHTRIIAEGMAVIIGEPTNRLELDFIEPHTGNGIKVENGGELAIYYSVIKNPRAGITVNAGGTLIEVAEVDFENCSECCIAIGGPGSLNCSIHYNTFTNSGCAVSAANLSEIYIAYNTVQGVEQGIYLSNVTNPLILHNTITSTSEAMPGIFLESCNGAIRENIISGHTNAIHLGNSSPDIGGNDISDNLYHGIYVGSGSLPKMDARLYYDPPNYYPVAGYNKIWENGGTTIGGPPDNDGSEIFFNSSGVILQEGCNSIYDDRPGIETPPYNTRLLMNGISFGGGITIHAEYNFWSDNPQYPLEERFGNLNVYYEPYLEDSCEIPVGGGGDGLLVKTSSGETVDTLYPINRTVGNLNNADYLGAEELFNQVVNSSDSLEVKLLAYQRLYEIGKLSSKPESYFNNLYSIYSSLSQSTSDTSMMKIFRQLSSLSLVGETEYIPAIEEFDQVIQQNPNTEEAVYAEIDALTAALLIEKEDSTLGKSVAAKYLIDEDEYQVKIAEILRKNFGAPKKTEEKVLIPTRYYLYQNYPNPFNPLTTIKYHLAEAGDVKLTVYDILGREIAILVSEQQQPGSYVVNWNASGFASGIYFYQLRNKNYIDTKKMILLR